MSKRVKSSVELVCSTQLRKKCGKMMAEEGKGKGMVKRMMIDYLVTREGKGD